MLLCIAETFQTDCRGPVAQLFSAPCSGMGAMLLQASHKGFRVMLQAEPRRSLDRASQGKTAVARLKRLLLVLACGLVCSVYWLTPGVAQSSAISDILQQLQGKSSGGISTTLTQPQVPPSQVITAGAAPLPPQPPSRIELILSQRAGTSLRLFGYDFFAGLNQVTIPQVGSVQSYYVLGPGDEIQIMLRGQENDNYDVVVGNDGNVILPKLPPLRAAGHTLADFQLALQDGVKRSYISTQAYVSVGQLRRVSVTVGGEVNVPGVVQLTGLSTPLDALILSLGVKKSGSLRAIKVYHAGRIYSYDLYPVLAGNGNTPSIRLSDGDRIVVPPLGHVVAVSGWVRRPAIYELAPGATSTSAAAALRMAGSGRTGSRSFPTYVTDNSLRRTVAPNRARTRVDDGGSRWRYPPR